MSFDLSHHGDADIVPGLVDLAVNVRAGGTPDWLAARIRATDLAAYPDQRAALAAVAARHARAAAEVLLTAGAAEAFVLLARALLDRGFAVRRGETFPGLGPGWIRVAVRDTATSGRFTEALAGVTR